MQKYLVRAAAIAGFAAILGLSIYTTKLRSDIAKRDAVSSKEVQKLAATLGGVQVALASERALSSSLGKENVEFIDRLRRVSPEVKPALHVVADASVVDPVIVLGPAEHRFEVAPDLKSLKRRQAFHLDVLVLRNANGKIEVGRVALAELDPETHVVLPDSKFTLESAVQVADGLLNPRVAVVHPRLIGGIESHGFPLIGVELLNGERFGGFWSHTNLSVFGIYDVKDKSVAGGASMMWRLFNSNISLGPAVFYGSRGVSYGGAVAVELTR